MKRSINSIFQRINSTYLKKKLAQQVIKAGKLPLKNGIWILSPEFSYHYSIRELPAPLCHVKQWGSWRTGTFLVFFINLLDKLIYPWFSYSTARLSSEAVDVILVNRLLDIVGFDFKNGDVLKTLQCEEAIKLLEYRSKIELIYNCVNMHFDFEKNLLVEDLIIGLPFTKLHPVEQLAVVNKLSNRLASSPSKHLPKKVVDSWFNNIAILLKNKRTNKFLQLGSDLPKLFKDVHVTWIHGDLFGENILIQDNLSEVLIDFDKVELAPAFTDLFTLFIFEAVAHRSTLLENFFKGYFDNVFASFGVDIKDQLDKKIAIFIAWLAWKQTSEIFEEINLIRFYFVVETEINRMKRYDTA